MAQNKAELAKRIDTILNASDTQVKTVEQGNALRKKIATALAEEIDLYVQNQIGQRLALILTAVNNQGADGNPIPLTVGPDFNSFTRTS